MKKNKLSRIEDFILPTFFLYQYNNMFEYSHNFRYKSKLFKTKFYKNVLEQKLALTNRTGLCSHEFIVANRRFAERSFAKLCYPMQTRRVCKRFAMRCTYRLYAQRNVGSFAYTSLQSLQSFCFVPALYAQPTLLPIAPLVQRDVLSLQSGALYANLKGGLRFAKNVALQSNEFIIISRKTCHQKITKVFLHSTYKTSYTITRPVINCPRKTITMMCRLSRLPVYPDLTNSKVRYARNRIRKQIIPTLQLFLNPKVEKALFKFSEFYNKPF